MNAVEDVVDSGEYRYVGGPSCVDLNNLIEVLRDFYSSRLDNVDPYMSRLYMPLEMLHPSNSLWSQVDTNDMRRCLTKFREEHKDFYDVIVQVHSLPGGRPSEELHDDYYAAVLELADYVYELL